MNTFLINNWRIVAILIAVVGFVIFFLRHRRREMAVIEVKAKLRIFTEMYGSVKTVPVFCEVMGLMTRFKIRPQEVGLDSYMQIVDQAREAIHRCLRQKRHELKIADDLANHSKERGNHNRLVEAHRNLLDQVSKLEVGFDHLNEFQRRILDADRVNWHSLARCTA